LCKSTVIAIDIKPSLLRPVGEWSIAITLSVCLFLSISLEPWDWSSRNFVCNPMWLWFGAPLAALRYAMYLQYYGWRHVSPQRAVWRCVASGLRYWAESDVYEW